MTPTHNKPFPASNQDKHDLLGLGFVVDGDLYLTYDFGKDHSLQVTLDDGVWCLTCSGALVHQHCTSEVSLEGLWQPRCLNDVIFLIKFFETGPK